MCAETRLFNALNTGLEPEAVCQMAGTCLASVLAKAAPPAPLSPRAVAALSRAVALISAPPANDNCETCKVPPPAGSPGEWAPVAAGG
jgi:hypothetical protein